MIRCQMFFFQAQNFYDLGSLQESLKKDNFGQTVKVVQYS